MAKQKFKYGLGLKELADKFKKLYDKYGDIPVVVFSPSWDAHRIVEVEDCSPYMDEFDFPISMNLARGYPDCTPEQERLIGNCICREEDKKDVNSEAQQSLEDGKA